MKAARQRLRGLALLGHGIAVEGGGNRPRLSGNVEQDRRNGAAEQRAPVEAGQHHDGRRRVHREGERQQDRNAIGTAETRKHADEHAEHQPHHHQAELLERHQGHEALEQQLERLHRISPLGCLD